MGKIMVEYKRNTLVAILTYLFITLALVLLGGCWGSLPPGPRIDAPGITGPGPGGTTPAPELFIAFGGFFLWGGIALAGISFVLGIASIAGIASGPLGLVIGLVRPFLRFAGWVGVGAIATGLVLRWVGNHPWLSLVGGVVAVAGWYLHRHPGVGGRLVHLAEAAARRTREARQREGLTR